MRPLRLAALTVLLVAAACSSQKDPARKLIADIDEVTSAAAAEAAQYVPEKLHEVEDRLGLLKAAYEQRDYARVVSQAPDVLSEAQSLAPEAAAKKDGMLRALNDAWTDLATEIPPQVAAVQARLDELNKKPGTHARPGIDLDASKTAIGAALSLWSKAQAAFAAGNMDEAVSTAKDVKVKVSDAATAVKLDLPKTTAT